MWKTAWTTSCGALDDDTPVDDELLEALDDDNPVDEVRVELLWIEEEGVVLVDNRVLVLMDELLELVEETTLDEDCVLLTGVDELLC